MRQSFRIQAFLVSVVAAVVAVVAFGLMLAPSMGRTAPADPGRLVVVELFTSQGCSSCPPADANVLALSARPNVLALSFAVTYWDQLGWKDTFARPAFTERQKSYAWALKHPAPFTPQVVVDGRADTVGIDRAEIEALIARESLAGGPTLSANNAAISVGSGAAPRSGADVWLVRFDPRVQQVPIGRGENGGRTLPEKNVVRTLQRLGRWTGGAQTYALPAAQAGLKSAILVQQASGGPILSALRL
ncbi:MAG TPA: DUF1223 domain-containing protein [Caulobacteraceae bacterium]|nr:DUF1223 domain-containing protein [Caulobacteraceae bacterium]